MTVFLGFCYYFVKKSDFKIGAGSKKIALGSNIKFYFFVLALCPLPGYFQCYPNGCGYDERHSRPNVKHVLGGFAQ